mmetsp:Transcript_71155/g.180147  ORF Transcript_71155/g.180147 Transcript_71155/m.180147 type:complete len:312 (-) Transcript_71155:118-1053(-)
MRLKPALRHWISKWLRPPRSASRPTASSSSSWRRAMRCLRLWRWPRTDCKASMDHHCYSSNGSNSSSSNFGSESEGQLVNFYGNLARSMLSLFQAMSGGVDWNDLSHPLVDNISPVQGVVFSFYIAFTVLALTNVVTGIFVDGALKSAQREQDDIMVKNLCEMFEGQGMTRLSISAFKQKLFSTEMQAYLESIGVDTREANILYELLDGDGSGSIDYEEFVGGCMRLRGQAKAIDVMYLLYETRHIFKTLTSNFHKIEGDLARMTKFAKLAKITTTRRSSGSSIAVEQPNHIGQSFAFGQSFALGVRDTSR